MKLIKMAVLAIFAFAGGMVGATLARPVLAESGFSLPRIYLNGEEIKPDEKNEVHIYAPLYDIYFISTFPGSVTVTSIPKAVVGEAK